SYLHSDVCFSSANLLFSVSYFVTYPFFSFFFFTAPPPTEIYTLSLHDALPICSTKLMPVGSGSAEAVRFTEGNWPLTTGSTASRSEEHTSELQSLRHLVCRLLLEKKKKKKTNNI